MNYQWQSEIFSILDCNHVSMYDLLIVTLCTHDDSSPTSTFFPSWTASALYQWCTGLIFWTVPFRCQDTGSPSCQRDIPSQSYHINTSSHRFLFLRHMCTPWTVWEFLNGGYGKKDQECHSMSLGITWCLVGSQFDPMLCSTKAQSRLTMTTWYCLHMIFCPFVIRKGTNITTKFFTLNNSFVALAAVMDITLIQLTSSILGNWVPSSFNGLTTTVMPCFISSNGIQ